MEKDVLWLCGVVEREEGGRGRVGRVVEVETDAKLSLLTCQAVRSMI